MTAPYRLMLGLLLLIQVATVTAYTDHDPGMDGLGITASGARTGPGVCAAGPSVPFDSVIIILGYGSCVVKDRGSCVVDIGVTEADGCKDVSNVDVWHASRDEALEIGRQQRAVIILPGEER